jgi:alcohol dehydrogenase class IV
LISPHLIPKRAICDPELTIGLPPILTAATGIDALTHCIETFLSPLINPPAEAIALDGAARAWRFIRRATDDGTDREARWEMMMAALEGGMTFQKGLGAVHSLSHAAGALRQPTLHHGMLNGVFLPHILRFNAHSVGNKYDKLRDIFGLERETDLAAAVSDLVKSLKLPIRLGQMGFEVRHIPETVVRALADHSNVTTPRKASAEEFEDLLHAAL